MIRKLFPALLLVGSFSYAQIGINGENPNATLDVIGNPGDPFKFDGIIAPRITGDQLRAKIILHHKTEQLFSLHRKIQLLQDRP